MHIFTKKNIQLAKSVAPNKSYFGIQLVHAGRKAILKDLRREEVLLHKKKIPGKLYVYHQYLSKKLGMFT